MKKLGAWMAKAAKAVGAAAIGAVVFAVGVLIQRRRNGGQETYQLYEVRTKKGRSGFPLGDLLGVAIDMLRPGSGGGGNPIPVSAPGQPSPATAPVAPTGGGGSSIGFKLRGDLMASFGLARHQAAGIVGNLAHESANFTILQEIHPVVAGSRGGYGYAQWTGPRRRDFEAWVASKGLDPASYAANWGFLHHELTATWEKRVIPLIKGARTVEEATRIFSNKYLRPGAVHMDSRIKYARKYL